MTKREKAIPFWADARRDNAHATLLDWPYKLHTNAASGRKARKDSEAIPAVVLYDVSKDPKETTDLAAQEPERVKQMTAALETWKASVQKSLAGGDFDPPLPPEALRIPKPPKKAGKE